MSSSGVEWVSGKMPADWPLSQSTSNDAATSMSVRRSLAVPRISSRLPVVSALSEPPLLMKFSSRRSIASADTLCSGSTLTPKPGTTLVPVEGDRDDVAGDGFPGGDDAIGAVAGDQRPVVHLQRALEHRQQLLARNRPAGRQRDLALDARIVVIGELQGVAEDDLHHLGQARILEIELIAVAARCSRVR